jgi:hypothetical protein
MNPLRLSICVLASLWLGSVPAAAAPAHSTAPYVAPGRVEAQRTCHHYRQTSRSHCTSTRLLRQAIVPRLHYPRRYYGTTHYSNPFQYYGYRPFYSPYDYYSPYWYRGSPFWY